MKNTSFISGQRIGLGSDNSYRKMTKYFSEVVRFSKKPDIFEITSKNIATSLFWHEKIKKSIDLVMFGGFKEVSLDKMRLRRDINIVLIGDPWTEKS